MKKRIRLVIIYFIVAACVILIQTSSSRYAETFNRTLTLNIQNPSYTITYYSNRNDGNPDQTSTQQIIYGSGQALTLNSFTKTGYNFTGWNTQSNGSGTGYDDGEVADQLSSINGAQIQLYAQWSDAVAEMDGQYYQSLQDAIDDVPTTGTKKVIKLLTNTAENISILAGKNIEFNFQTYTLRSPGTGPVIENNGTIEIKNGRIEQPATTDGAVNNRQTGRITMTGGLITMTAANGKQALYNEKGYVKISGTAELRSISSGKNIRATVQNQSGGTLEITGGTIVSANFHGVQNAGTLIIGEQGGGVSTTSPSIQGYQYGVNSTTNFKFYDGILKGKNGGINDVTKANTREPGYGIDTSTEQIGGETYNTAYLIQIITVTFVPGQGGQCSTPTKNLNYGDEIGQLPTATKTGATFIGWFTAASGGRQIDEHEIITADISFYAHWSENAVAEINGTQYTSIAAAVSAAPANTQTTITLISDVNENVTIGSKKNIILDLQNHTLSNVGSARTIKNDGTLEVTNGTVTSDTGYATIDNDTGATLKINGATIRNIGTRSAIYNYSTLEITGNSYIIARPTGAPDNSSMERGTVHNLATGTAIIRSGTIIGEVQQAVSNEGTVIIGTSRRRR